MVPNVYSKDPIVACPFKTKVQEKSITKLHRWHDGDAPLALLAMCTGSGKTRTAAKWVGSPGYDHLNVVWVTHRLELIDQAIETFQVHGGSRGARAVRWESDGVCPSNTTMVSIQALADKRDGVKHLMESLTNEKVVPDVLIIDEAHHAKANTYVLLWDAIRARNPRAKCLNLTATPYLGVTNNPLDLGEVITELSLCDAMAENIVVPPRLSYINLPSTHFAALTPKALKQKPDLMSEVMLSLVDECVDSTLESAAKGNMLVFGCTVEHMQALRDRYIELGVPEVGILTYATPAEERAKMLEDFKKGTLKVLINHDILAEGNDLPNVRTVGIFRPTHEMHRITQMIGRGLRTAEGKEHCDIVMMRTPGAYKGYGLTEVTSADLELVRSLNNYPLQGASNFDAAFGLLTDEKGRMVGIEAACEKMFGRKPPKSIDSLSTFFDIPHLGVLIAWAERKGLKYRETCEIPASEYSKYFEKAHASPEHLKPANIGIRTPAIVQALKDNVENQKKSDFARDSTLRDMRVR